MRNPSSLLAGFNQAQSQLVVQTADLPLGTLADMVRGGAIDLEPGFQRRERWHPDKQSALIESFLLNVPVPPVYLAEEINGTYTAIDGKQRLKAITDFINNEFPLKNLERLSDAEGFRFNDLPNEIANSLRLRPFLRVVTLLKQTNPTLKYEVFLRLNRGGEILNAQEIRNVAFRGRMNDAVYRLSENPFLRQQLKIRNSSASAYKAMLDAEYVLRFLTLQSKGNRFSGKFVDEMNDFMQDHQNDKAQEVRRFEELFSITIEKCEQLWGDKAFKRPEGTGWRDQFLAGVYDAQMLAVARLTPDALAPAIANQPELLRRTRELFDDDEFDTAVRAGTNTPARIDYRISRVYQLLQSI